jgi:putative phosphoesterase
MKYLVASDIHGSIKFTLELEKRIIEENPDKIILLGDLLYQGARGVLNPDYRPYDVAMTLNKYKDKILCTKGNCDIPEDVEMCDFELKDNIVLDIEGKKFFFTHGHIYNNSNRPSEFDALIYGHFHTGFIYTEEGKIYANPGSVSIPKNNTKNSYMIIDNNKIILKEINGTVIEETNF